MGSYNTLATRGQSGWSNPWLGAPWIEVPGGMVLNHPNSNIGLQFELCDLNSLGMPLDPPIVYPSFDLNLTRIAAAGAPAVFTVSVWWVPEHAPEPYSETLYPTARDEELLTTGEWDSTDIPFSVTVPVTDMFETIRHSDWNGIISLTITAVSVPIGQTIGVIGMEGTTSTAPNIVTEETPFHTGFWEGPAMGRRARTRHCPRTGMPVASDEMVRDGYTQGTWVSPEGWDPEDPPERYVPNPRENVVDDET